MTIRVRQPGVQTTVQDGGRGRARHLGVPQSGAADRLSLALANRAVGNDWDAAALECAMSGPVLEFAEPALIAVSGADMDARINNERIPPYTARDVKAGNTLTLSAARMGARAYIAFAGGLSGESFLRSVSTLVPARLGGAEGRPLRAGDVIATKPSRDAAPVDIPSPYRPRMSHDWILRATPGPEAAVFEETTRARFFAKPFTANARANRMGLQLDGASIAPPDDFSMNSSPIFPGAVQAPPSGAPFLLLADAQTTGGYARIAQVIDVDLHLAGQIRPGDRVWFREISPEQARAVAAERIALYSTLLPGFRFG